MRGIALPRASSSVKTALRGLKSLQKEHLNTCCCRCRRFLQQPSLLQRAGSNRFDPAGAATTASTATVAQGSLEQSGVDVATCMIDMIRLNRIFDMSSKAASTITNDMDSRSISDVSTGR